MHRIDGEGATQDNTFSEGNPQLGIYPTTVTADWCNDVQETLCRAIEGMGGTLEKGNYVQLLDALLAMRSKQYIVNPAFEHWLNNTGLTSVTSGRWATLNKVIALGDGASITVSRQSHTVGQTDVPTTSPYFARLTSASGSDASGEVVAVNIPIESVRTLQGKRGIITLYAKASTGTPNISIDTVQAFGTGGSPSAVVVSNTTKIALSTSWVKYQIPVTMPSISGKTIGTDLNDYIEVVVWLSAGTTYNDRTNSLGRQSITVDIGLITLTEGTLQGEYAERDKDDELSLIGRYYQKSYKNNVMPGTPTYDGCDRGSGISEYYIGSGKLSLAPKMRTAPVITLYSPATGVQGAIRNLSANADLTNNMTVENTTESGFLVANSGNLIILGNLYMYQFEADAML